MINVLIQSEDINPINIINSNNYNLLFNLEGKEIIETLINLDIIVIDYFSASLDFLSKVKALKKLNSKIKIIVGLSFINESFIRILYDNGVDYILIKPLDIKTLLLLFNKIYESNELTKRIEHNSKSSISIKINKILNLLGMPANLKGYSYIKEALELCKEDHNYYLHTTSYLYPKLSKKFHAKDTCIEKAIRSAIELCWCRGNIETQEQIFGYTVDRNKGRPTNSEFLAQILNYLNVN